MQVNREQRSQVADLFAREVGRFETRVFVVSFVVALTF
jgi:hypothetical protein